MFELVSIVLIACYVGMVPMGRSAWIGLMKRKVPIMTMSSKDSLNRSPLNIFDSCGVSVYSPELAQEYNIEYLNRGDIETDNGLVLAKNENYLELSWGNGSDIKEKPFRINFNSNVLLNRSHSYRNELIFKAFKSVSTQKNAAIIDMTAGLGRDSFILASAGLKVLMIERNPVLYLLLQDALKQLQNQSVANNLELVYCDSTDASITDIITDVTSRWYKQSPIELSVYLDPMYQNTSVGKRSLVKKDTQMLHRLVQAEINEENNKMLFQQASQVATNKIVVKRPKSADFIHREAHDCIVGSTHRFDVYYTQRFTKITDAVRTTL